MNNKSICRTAPATQSLLKTLKKLCLEAGQIKPVTRTKGNTKLYFRIIKLLWMFHLESENNEKKGKLGKFREASRSYIYIYE